MSGLALITLLVLTPPAMADVADDVLAETGIRYRETLHRSDQIYPDARVAAYLQSLLDDLNPIGDVRVEVVDDVESYALAVPADLIVVSTGLLLRTATIQELRGLLAHELAHHLEHHHERQWRMARQTESKLLNRVPWIGTRRRAATMSQFSDQLELEADAGAVSLLRSYDSGRGLLALLARLKTEIGGDAETLERRLQSLGAQISGTLTDPSDAEGAYRDAMLEVRTHALGQLLLRREFGTIEALRSTAELDLDWQALDHSPPLQVGREANATSVSSSGIASTSVANLMDGWVVDVPRDWQRARRQSAVVMTRDGATLHRMDARCVAPSRAYYVLGEPASEDPEERVAQVVADLLRQIQDFRAQVELAETRPGAVGEVGTVRVGYRDARGLQHVVTSAHIFDGAYFCELRWFTPKIHFFDRDEEVFASICASLRKR